MPKKHTLEDFILIANNIHNNKYDYSKVNYINNRTKVCIICSEHGEFWQTPDAHLRGQGCPTCRYIKSSSKCRMKQSEFINKANCVHNNKYNYSKINYKNTDTKVTITCPMHGDFQQTPHHHLSGSGCPECGRKTYNTEEFIRRANLKHNNKYDYSKTSYKGKTKKVTITCKIHGDFEQLPQNHLTGKGCPECGLRFGKQEKIVLNVLKENYNNVIHQYTNSTFLKGKRKNLTLDFFIPDYNIGIEYQGIQHFYPLDAFGGENSFKIVSERDKYKYRKCIENGVQVFYISFENNIPDNYFVQIHRTTEGLLKTINEYIINVK